MSSTEKLKVRRVPVARLTPRWVEEMWELYASYYEHIDRTRFERDLREKQCVFLGIERRTGRLRAFSTARFYDISYRGRRIGVYFSGDTMVHPRYWGDRALQRKVVPALLRWRLRHPFRRVYWHLTCNGYRTLLTLANSFPEYWPHPARGLPDWERGLIDLISHRQFGSAWCPEAGVVRDDVRLKAHIAPFTPEVRAIPVVRFFLDRNPGFARGEELSMVGRVDFRFFLKVSAKLLRIRGARARADRADRIMPSAKEPEHLPC